MSAADISNSSVQKSNGSLHLPQSISVASITRSSSNHSLHQGKSQTSLLDKIKSAFHRSSSSLSGSQESLSDSKNGAFKDREDSVFSWPSPTIVSTAEYVASEPVVAAPAVTLTPREPLKVNTLKLQIKPFALKKKSATVAVDNDEDSETLGDLPAVVKSKISTVSPETLTGWLSDSLSHPLDASKSVIILDLRTFIEFNSQHILGSYNLAVPQLLVQRYRRGSLTQFVLERLLTSQEGKQKWSCKTTEKIVIVDAELPDRQRDFATREFLASSIGSLGASLEKEMKETPGWANDIFWLCGGYNAFVNYCRGSSQTVSGTVLKNTRFIDVSSEEDPLPEAPTFDKPLPSAGLSCRRKPGFHLDISTSNPDLSSTANSASLMMKLGNKLDKLQKGLVSILHISPPHSPSSLDPLSFDYSEILPWLLLGADPAVITASTKLPSSSIGSDDIAMLESPVFPRSPLSFKAKVSPSTASPPQFSSLMSPSAASPPQMSALFSAASVNTPTSTHANQGSPKSFAQYLHISATAEKIQHNGIKYVLNMASESPDLGAMFKQQAHKNQSVANTLSGYLKVPTYDYADEDMDNAIAASLAQIDEWHSKDPTGKVLVHCRAGKSRSATIVMAYLMKSQKWSLSKAEEHVRLRRPIIAPNLGFMSVLKALDTRWNNGHQVETKPNLE